MTQDESYCNVNQSVFRDAEAPLVLCCGLVTQDCALVLWVLGSLCIAACGSKFYFSFAGTVMPTTIATPSTATPATTASAPKNDIHTTTT